MKRRILYLGPPGSFSHQAADALSPVGSFPEPRASVRELIQDVQADKSMFGVVPIENSVDGEVTAHIDEIIFRTSSVMVCAEVVIPVSFNAFCVDPSIPPRVAVSHPVALAQCQRFIAALGLETRATESTSAACAQISEMQEQGAVALASGRAGPIYDLAVFREGIEDNPEAHTKFYLISHTIRRRVDGAYKTWLAFVPPSNRTGVLAEILGCFAERGIAVHSISSRPLKSQIGAYCFHLTFDGSIEDEATLFTIQDLLRLGCSIRLLGSFSAWVGHGVLPSIFSLGGITPGQQSGFARSLPELHLVD